MSVPVNSVGLPVSRTLHFPGGPQGVLLLHGLASGPQELQFLARGLQRSGYTVRVPVIRGYSHAPGQSLYPHADWAAAALSEFDALLYECDSVAVGGLCIGAVLALQVALMRPTQVNALLALSTTLHYDGWASPWSRRLLPLAAMVPWVGNIGVRERAPFGVKDERMRAWIAKQMREAGASDAGAAVLHVRDLLESRRLMAAVRIRLPEITAPTLLLHARDDAAASLRSAFEVAQRVSSVRLHCVVLRDCYHMISIDREKQCVLAELVDFLSQFLVIDSGAARASGLAHQAADISCQSRSVMPEKARVLSGATMGNPP